jgi:nicotinate-nucleotide adenylyltransferase
LRIALFGGTFDPIHNAHLTVAREAAHAFALDRVLLIPAAHPPHKPNGHLTPYADRLRMVELACAGDPLLEASRLEDHEGKSYSIDTIERARETLRDAELFFLIGADAFHEIETWRRWPDVIACVDFIVVTRPGHVYRTPLGARVHRLDTLALSISSSEIRQAVVDGKLPVELPPVVWDYIREHRLYGGEKRTGSSGPSARR